MIVEPDLSKSLGIRVVRRRRIHFSNDYDCDAFC